MLALLLEASKQHQVQVGNEQTMEEASGEDIILQIISHKQGWEGRRSRDEKCLGIFFVQPVKDQDLVNQTWFYSAKWGISPRTTSEVGQDEVTAVCWGRQHKPWLPNTPHTHTHLLSQAPGFGIEPRVHQDTTAGSVPRAMP